MVQSPIPCQKAERKTFKFGGGNILVWGLRLTELRYKIILNDVMYPLPLIGKFKQDNDQEHSIEV